MSKGFDRRDFVRIGAAGAGTLLFKSSHGGAQTSPAKDHFFLNVFYPGGLDSRYFFDARPRSMTDAQRFVNYWPEEPVLMKGNNGGETWRSTIVNPLMEHQDDFTVVNGVHMLVAFDGHLQCQNYLFTGSAFGGESFVPHLNSVQSLAMDVIEAGSFNDTEITNIDRSVSLSAKSTAQFSQRLNSLPLLSGKSPLGRFVEERMRALALGDGGFNNAAKKMFNAHCASADLTGRVKGFRFAESELNAGNNSILESMALVREVFRARIATSASWFPGSTQNGGILDTHDGARARLMPGVAQGIAADIASMFKFLKETAFDDTRSLFDVTTVVVSSEFSRSLRAIQAFETAGNDHNPFTNSILIGGKGIVGGNVIGQSNYRSTEEVFAGPIGAHQELDKIGVRPMGKAFDFATGSFTEDMPKTYRAADYLTINSLVNTIYSLFGVDEKYYRVNDRNGPLARIVPALLS